MATEYRLSYTAAEIDEKLGRIDTLSSDKLDASELSSAIDTALAEAKASGEFDGQDGSVWYFINKYVAGEPLQMVSSDAKNGDYCLHVSEGHVYYAENGKWKQIGTLKGVDGKTAHTYAKEHGYTGTEDEFGELLANMGDISHWKGKKWYAYGTSLTSTAQGKYASLVAELGGMSLTNKGIPGGGIVSNTNVKNAVMNTTDGKQEADLITLEVGANDTSARLGSIYDTGDDTFCGALNQCIRYLQANTNAQIVVISSTNSNKREPGYLFEEPADGQSFVNALNLDDADVIAGYHISKGDLVANEIFNESGYIPVTGSRMYLYYSHTNKFSTNLCACFYNENKEYIGFKEILTTDYYPVPEGAVYVRVPFKTEYRESEMIFFADEGDEIAIPETSWAYVTYREAIFTLGGDGQKFHTKLDQWKAIRDVCMVNSVPYIPMGEEGGLGYARLTDIYLADTIHHNNLGGYNLAQFVWSRLKNIPLWKAQL